RARSRYAVDARNVRRPVWNRRRRAHAEHLLNAARQAGVVQRATDERRLRNALKYSDAAANDRAWPTRGAGEGRDLRAGSVRPRETEPRTHVRVTRHVIVRRSKNT